MRAGVNCAAQQTLSAEAASALKHSLSLARRRGHAQVTPLHVAATLLGSRASPLRRACLKSQPNEPSHPLQCRALELCFNVALNRLPATPAPLLQAQPSLSNALVAALKRAQAHQRRGCVEQSPPPLVGAKVELEQLILSILDDPSVSRVMREAGFSSPAVKNNVEESTNSVSSVFQCYSNSGGIYSTPSSPPNYNEQNHNSTFWHSNLMMSYVSEHPLIFSPQKSVLSKPISYTSSLKEDIKLVFEVLLRKKRPNTVIVGDSTSMNEALVAEVMSKLQRGDVPEELKAVYFVKFQFSQVPLQFMKREEVDMQVINLKRKVESFASKGGRVIIYTGDLKWTVEEVFCAGKEVIVYSPVDHLVCEIAKLLSLYNNDSLNTRLWLMATASYQTYMKCQTKQPPLDVQWGLQAVSVPSGGLGLSLNATSTNGVNSRFTFNENPSNVMHKRPFFGKEEDQDVLNCCPECTSNYEKEASQCDSLSLSKKTENGSVQLSYWLRARGMETSEKEDLILLRRKYNRQCQILHRGAQNPNHSNANYTDQSFLGRSYFNTSSYPCWPNTNIFGDSDTISFGYSSVKPNHISTALPRFRRQQSCHIEFSFDDGNSKHQSVKPNLDSLKSMDDKEVKITLALGNSMFAAVPNSRLNSEVCKTLQENFPWQKEVVPSIIQALMDPKGFDQDKWLLVQGDDFIGKRRLAIGIAKSMLGSSDLVFCLNMSENTRTSTQNCEILHKALKDHEKMVILVEDVDCADPEFVKFLDDGFESGDMGKFMKRDRDSGNNIMILTTNDSLSFIKKRNIKDSVIQMKIVVSESKLDSRVVSVDHKRKSDWDSPTRIKSRRNGEIEEAFSNELDLNLKVDEDEQVEDKAGDLSPISSDLTREITMDQWNSPRFLEKIKNRFVFNRSTDQENQAKGMFLSMFKRSFHEACEGRNISSFHVDEMVLEEVFQGSGFYLNNLFEQWLNDVFQRSLHMVNNGARGDNSVRLCLGGEGEYHSNDGFMGTSLPNGIQVSFIV